jgi:RNA polymerase sigma-70 factor (family 1)
MFVSLLFLPFEKKRSQPMIDSIEVTRLQKLIALSNDQAAYVRLFRIYFTPLHHFACTIVQSKQIAEEIISDVFLQIWQNREKLDSILNLTVYLYTCTRNQALNVSAREKRQSTSTLEEACLYIASSAPDPAEIVINAELVKEIKKSVEQLPGKCRAIFKMVKEDGMKYREVAEILGISVKTVEAQIGIAIKKIDAAITPFTSKKEQRNAVKIISFANRKLHFIAFAVTALFS